MMRAREFYEMTQVRYQRASLVSGDAPRCFTGLANIARMPRAACS
jgi:hypothetical protein